MPKTIPRSSRKPGRRTRQPGIAAATSARPRARPRLEEAIVGAPLVRVFDVHTRLTDGMPTTSTHLVALWGVSTRTAKRCVELMRDSLNMPIAWNAATKTYYYTRPFPALPFLILSRAEALAMALAGRVCAGMFGPTFGRLLDDILKKIAPALGSAVTRAVKSIQHVHAPEAGSSADEFALLLPLIDAIESRRVVRFNYTSRGGSTAEPRLVHPLDIGHFHGSLRLIAFHPARGEIRDYVLTRIHDLKPGDEVFQRPGNYDAKTRVENCAGFRAGETEQEIRIALDPLAAAYARERAWHHSQQLTALPDGRTEMTLRLGDLPGIKNHVLRWGSHAEVLTPRDLREDVRRELQATLARYATSD